MFLSDWRFTKDLFEGLGADGVATGEGLVQILIVNAGDIGKPWPPGIRPPRSPGQGIVPGQRGGRGIGVTGQQGSGARQGGKQSRGSRKGSAGRRKTSRGFPSTSTTLERQLTK